MKDAGCDDPYAPPKLLQYPDGPYESFLQQLKQKLCFEQESGSNPQDAHKHHSFNERVPPEESHAAIPRASTEIEQIGLLEPNVS